MKAPSRHTRSLYAVAAMMALPAMLFAHGSVFAGSAPAELTCTPLTKGSEMRIDGTVPADSYTLSVKVSSRGNAYTLDNDNAKETMIPAFADGVYVLSIQSTEGRLMLELYALPSTMKRKPLPTGIQATFHAKLTAIRPSKYAQVVQAQGGDGSDIYVRDIKMACTYLHEI
jgi:hypothetical protein